MDPLSLILYAVLMAVGLAGVLVPGLPGLLLVAVVGVVWAVDLGGASAWAVLGVMVVVLGLGTVAKYVLPGRTLKEAGAPTSTLLWGAVGAIVGFFVVPLVGVLLGAVAGVYLGEWRRLREPAGAWRSTVATAKAIGLGILLELAAGVLAVGVWLVAALFRLG